MLRVGVLVSGGGTNLQALIDDLTCHSRNAQIVTVVSNKCNAYALERAEKYNINTQVIRPKDYENATAFSQGLVDHFQEHKVDLIVMAGYLVVVGNPLISTYHNRIINVHPSLIPSFCGNGYYGMKVHEAVLKKGVKLTGATVHFVDEGTDTGPIILQKAVEVKNQDTPASLQQRVMEEAEWSLLPKAVELIASGLITVEDGRVIIEE